MKLRKNIGTSGRLIRLAVAILLLAFAYWKMSWTALILALFILFECLMSWCIIYQLLGKNNCSIKR